MTAVNQTNRDEMMTIDDIMQHDLRFRYGLLGRMRSDCEYYLNYGNRSTNRLWTHDEELQIEYMTKIHDGFKEDEKPEWLTMDEIIAYGKKMIIKHDGKM